MYSNIAGQLDGQRVLVVDDNSTNRSILKIQLEQWKLVPVLANSGEEALRILSISGDFDLIITDMQMPVMDGEQLARIVRGCYPHIPIILLSSLGDERNKNSLGLFSSVLTKPVKQNMLSRHILTELRKQEKTIVRANDTKPKLQIDFSQKYPLRILVAEDNPVNQRLAERILNKLGYVLKWL